MAQRHGISRQTVSEIWRAFALKPWRQDEFKISPDLDLIEKIRDLVGLYLSPPVAAPVYAVDEKPQIQALNRSAPIPPILPMLPPPRRRPPTTTSATPAWTCLPPWRSPPARSSPTTQVPPAAGFIAFLNKVDREVTDDLDVHVILDNH
jgi:hypothetical protein